MTTHQTTHQSITSTPNLGSKDSAVTGSGPGTARNMVRSHTRTTTTVHLAGPHRPLVATQPGTVAQRADPAGTYGTRTLTVTLADSVLIYCTRRVIVEELASLFQDACQHLLAVPLTAPHQVGAALRPRTDAATTVTTALTYREVPGLRHRLRPMTPTNPAQVILTMGPLTVVLYDRGALLATRDAWSDAGELARAHWAPHRMTQTGAQNGDPVR